MARKAAAPARKRGLPAAPRGKTNGAPGSQAEVQHPRELAPQTADTIMEGAVDSLRRLLNELLEHRLEAVAGALADVRREVATGAGAERVLGVFPYDPAIPVDERVTPSDVRDRDDLAGTAVCETYACDGDGVISVRFNRPDGQTRSFEIFRS